MSSMLESAIEASDPAFAAARTPEPVPFGLKDGRLYEPLQVERGLACGCTCPGCGARLVAKHAPSGKVRPHFAHQKDSDCVAGRETALHLAAKQLIEDRKELFFPRLRVEARGRVGFLEERAFRISVVRAGLRALERAVPETLVGRTRPDLLVTSQGQEVFVEVAVTHFVDAQKLAKLAALGYATVEFNLADLRDFTFDELSKRLFEPSEQAAWVFHPEEAAARERAQTRLQALLDEDAVVWELEEKKRAEEEAEREKLRKEEERRKAAVLQRRAAWKLKQEAESMARAAAFKQAPNETKLAKVARYLGLGENELPDFVGVWVRGANCIAAPLQVWQLAVFAYFVADATEKRSLYVTSELVQEWLHQRFVIKDSGSSLAVAVWDYLQVLEGRDLLHRIRKQSFVVTVAGCAAAINVANENRAPGRHAMAWVEDWPDSKGPKRLGEVFGEHFRHRELWERVAGLLPDVREMATPVETVLYYIAQYRGDAAALRRFFLSAGFARLG